jgi:CRISPR system Cascade subunit CasA
MFINYNLLTEPIFTVDRSDGQQTALSLPGLLAGLCSETVVGLARVAAHQRQVIFRLLTQLAAIALSKNSVSHTASLPHDETTWATLLRQLTPDYPNDEPWSLLVEDISKPAFLQPAILATEGLAPYNKVLHTSDILDVLNTAKAHDVKPGRLKPNDAELWLYALITLQTSQGYFGSGNQGIARMNGAYGSRCFISRVPGLRMDQRFDRDLRMLLYQRDQIIDRYDYKATDGLALVWLRPWDDDVGIQLNQLDPYFIEICRRIRLVRHSTNVISALFRTSNQPRLDAKVLNGNVGDPWIPINKDEAALTVSGEGFTTQTKCDILFGRNTISKRPLSLESVPGVDTNATMIFIGSVFVRGQGITQGLHEFAIPIPNAVRDRLAMDEGLGGRAQTMLTEANIMRLKVLGPALLTLLQGRSEDSKKKKDDRDRDWRDAFTEKIDEIFFDELWQYASEADENKKHEAIQHWILRLRDIGFSILTRAMHSVPIPAARRLQAEAQAELLFENTFRKYFGVYLS